MEVWKEGRDMGKEGRDLWGKKGDLWPVPKLKQQQEDSRDKALTLQMQDSGFDSQNPHKVNASVAACTCHPGTEEAEVGKFLGLFSQQPNLLGEPQVE